MSLLYIGLAGVFFALTLLLVNFSEKLRGNGS
jgi:preprotein translocase subunit SecG